jgi:hypothetical protein
MHHGTPLLPPLANVGKLFKSTQTQPAQSNRINDIEHTIPLVTKPKLVYIYYQNNYLPEQIKYNKCTFTALLMTA